MSGEETLGRAPRGASSRPPRQQRGRRRVDAILDATAEILAGEGLEAVTMHGVARRSRTAIGSMYHFFADRDALLAALGERHGDALRAILAAMEEEVVDWRGLTVEQSIDRALGPHLAYIERHPDVLLMRRAFSGRTRVPSRESEFDALLVRSFERVIAARTPDVPLPERRARAATLVAMLHGIAGMMASPAAPPHRALAREIRRAAAAYLAAAEAAGHARPDEP